MTVIVFDLFSIGIGPSSSHTVGPMRAARSFSDRLVERGLLERTGSVRVELYGSLAATGAGHGSDRAVLLGLEGYDPETVDTTFAQQRLALLAAEPLITLAGARTIAFDLDRDFEPHPREQLPFHPNGLRFHACDPGGEELLTQDSYSVGGGFVVTDPERETPETARAVPESAAREPYPYGSAQELLRLCRETGLTIDALSYANECARRPADAVRSHLQRVWAVMQECVEQGCHTEGTLPGGLNVPRRAAAICRSLQATSPNPDPLEALDWVNVYAMAVNEQNAAGGRLVTAPTNGAAGIIPAVMHYYVNFCEPRSGGEQRHSKAEHPTVAPLPAQSEAAELTDVERFLLTAGAIGSLYKENASISGAEVGCQGEVGSASSMAAAGLCEVLGGTPAQVENAAEIAMEHNLGLTCDPVKGLVQVPCIERNAMGAVKAINAARIALRGNGTHVVSLDQVIDTMRETGADMKTAYKETSLAGLAVNVVDC